MNWIVYHIVSGHSYFTGVALLVVAAVASVQPRPIFSRIAVFAYLLGCISIMVSSTAVPVWLAVAGVAVTFGWIVARFRVRLRRKACYGVLTVAIIAALFELPYHMTPRLNPATDRTVTVIGDSITAGLGGDDRSETWPAILAREKNLAMQDFSHMGDTAASALKRVRSHEPNSSIVIIEIGGNDILGSTTP
ncbi:MAG: acyl-CoA thioesterase, partial [Planctomycetaceae bacterium]|nr:acyl-CoA thioesterase [Planctomycetaceae bacterium]